MPQTSLGYTYYKYMIKHNFNTDERPAVKYIQDPDIAYAILRYRQIHDFWHVICDLPPTLLGEITLKWFEWKHTGLPSAALSAYIAPIRLNSNERNLLRTQYIPWATRTAQSCSDLMVINYEHHLYDDLQDLRNIYNIEKAPTDI